MDEPTLKTLMAHLSGQHAAHSVILRVLAREIALRNPDPRAFATAIFDAISLFLDQGDDEAKDEFALTWRAAQRETIDGFFHALVRELSPNAGGDGT